MKGLGMPVVSFRGVNYPFWYHLGFQDGTQIFLAIKVSFRVARGEMLNTIRLCWCVLNRSGMRSLKFLRNHFYLLGVK